MNTQFKQYLFAPYIGQKVVHRDNQQTKIGHKPDVLTIKAFSKLSDYPEAYLLLRPLSSITDAEAIEVAKINGWADCMSRKEMISHGRSDVLKLDTDYHLSIFAYQYLQQSGFAMPVYFDGEFFSVEKLTELGIVKLSE